MTDDLKKHAIAAMKAIPKVGGDVEANHLRADEVLCDLLTSLGYKEVVDEWETISKWYA